MGPLADLLAFELASEVPHRDDDLRGGVVEADLLVPGVVEEPDAGIEQVLDHKAGTEDVASEAGLIAQHDHIEGSGLGRVQQGQEGRTLLELGPALGVVHEDVLGCEGPALRGDVPRGLLALHL
ncbi:hypothetical protein WMF27_20675 [Sorangium sp. So ce281]